MIANLFSTFDPTSRIFYLPLNWLSTLIGLFILPYLYWALPNRRSLLWSKTTLLLHNEFKNLLGPRAPGGTLIFIRIFRLIVYNNFLGLLPFVFTRTRHLSTTLRLRLPLWLAFFFYGWLNKTQHILAHLVPARTPPLLMPVMVLIETIRNIIRPGTLAIRLAANIIAGHLILRLLGGTGPALPYFFVLILLSVQTLLLLLEGSVAVIQSYVFAALSTLYAREVN